MLIRIILISFRIKKSVRIRLQRLISEMTKVTASPDLTVLKKFTRIKKEIAEYNQIDIRFPVLFSKPGKVRF